MFESFDHIDCLLVFRLLVVTWFSISLNIWPNNSSSLPLFHPSVVGPTRLESFYAVYYHVLFVFPLVCCLNSLQPFVVHYMIWFFYSCFPGISFFLVSLLVMCFILLILVIWNVFSHASFCPLNWLFCLSHNSNKDISKIFIPVFHFVCSIFWSHCLL